MCGVCGIFNRTGNPVNRGVLLGMANSIAHRGPDGQGIHIDREIGFAHRRLAIIDLSTAGAQPMSTRSGRFVICYNGMIYNFRELRKQLELLGHQFRSSSDTEVVAQAWEQWGVESVSRLNGMFSFAVLDTLKRTVTLVRDRYGIKPMYYYLSRETLVFGSEQRAVLAAGHVKRQVDTAGLYEYLTFQNILSSRTLLQDVVMLPAGHTLTVSAEFAHLNQYWDFDFRSRSDLDESNEYREELDRLLRQAVQRQLVSDVEIGSYLSGGVDSGTITALATQEIPNIKSFTCGFDVTSAFGRDATFDERDKARMAASLIGTDHYEMTLTAADMSEAIEVVVSAIEEPRVGQSYPNYFAARLARRSVKVVLSGTGGDELFAGYPWRYYQTDSRVVYDDFVDQYLDTWRRLIPKERVGDILRPAAFTIGESDIRRMFSDIIKSQTGPLSEPSDYINRSLYFEAKTFLHGLLVVEDKLSMIHGLETRVPFLDNDLVDFAIRCPVAMKMRRNSRHSSTSAFESGSRDGKSILREVMERYFPPEIAKAPKQGFSSPDASWFRNESARYVNSVLSDKTSPIFDYLEYSSVNAIVAEHHSGRVNHRLFIWSLLSLDIYFRKMMS